MQDCLEGKAKFGHSKYADRAENGRDGTKASVYSYSTMSNYIDAGSRFGKWARANYGCRDLAEARQYTGAYLQHRIDTDKSAWTILRDACALAKIYDCKTTDLGCALPKRHRADITQHRDSSTWQGHFSESRNADLVALCKASGLRRHEVAALRPADVTQTADGRTYIHVECGKGGKSRDVECLSDDPYRIAQAAIVDGRDRVIEHIPKYAPIHEYRREYAQDLYDRIARPVDDLPAKEVYCCSGDQTGLHYDKAAMRTVSRALGHNRLEVVTHYLSHGLTETETIETVEEETEELEEAND